MDTAAQETGESMVQVSQQTSGRGGGSGRGMAQEDSVGIPV